MEDATLCETADAAPASLGAASGSGAKIDQSHTCQSSEKRTRDEGAKLAATFAQIKRARRAQSRAGGPGQCRGRAAPSLRASYPLPCFGRSHSYHTRTPPPSQGRRRPDHRGGRRAALPLQAVGDRCAAARELPPTQQPHAHLLPTLEPRLAPTHLSPSTHARCMLCDHGDAKGMRPGRAPRCTGYKGVVDLGKAGPGHYKAQVCRRHTILDCTLDPPQPALPIAPPPAHHLPYPPRLPGPLPLHLYPFTLPNTGTSASPLSPTTTVSHYPAPRLSLSSALSASLTTITRPTPTLSSTLPPIPLPMPCRPRKAESGRSASSPAR